MRCLVISGGGSKGAFAGGVVEFLDREYDLYVGTSTGSLMVPMIAAEALNQLKQSYTNTTQSDIFKVSPFKITKSENGSVKVDMSIINILYNLIIRRKKSLGDSSNLRKNISKFLTKKDYDFIRTTHRDVLVCVTNSSTGNPEYKSIRECSLEDFYDWIWASTSAYPFMDSVLKDGNEYVDGGLTDPCPIQEAIDRGATEIDAIVLRTEDGTLPVEFIRNPIQGLGRVIDVMLKEINKNDIQIASLNAKGKDVKLNIYYTPRILTNNSLVFDNTTMKGWWEEGYKHAEAKNNVTYIIKGVDITNKLVSK